MGIVLDSSVLIAAERGRFDLPGLLAAHPAEQFLIAAITASELLHGCERATDPLVKHRRMRFVEGVLQDFVTVPFALAEAREHARVWAQLEIAGTPIGERDLLIAATALAGGFSVATLNRREFARVPALALLDLTAFEITPRGAVRP